MHQSHFRRDDPCAEGRKSRLIRRGRSVVWPRKFNERRAANCRNSAGIGLPESLSCFARNFPNTCDPRSCSWGVGARPATGAGDIFAGLVGFSFFISRPRPPPPTPSDENINRGSNFRCNYAFPSRLRNNSPAEASCLRVPLAHSREIILSCLVLRRPRDARVI